MWPQLAKPRKIKYLTCNTTNERFIAHKTRSNCFRSKRKIDDFVFAEMKMIRVAKTETYNHKTPHDTRRMPQTCSGFYCLLSKQQNISFGRPNWILKLMEFLEIDRYKEKIDCNLIGFFIEKSASMWLVCSNIGLILSTFNRHTVHQRGIEWVWRVRHWKDFTKTSPKKMWNTSSLDFNIYFDKYIDLLSFSVHQFRSNSNIFE